MVTSHSLPEILTALSSEEPQLRAGGALHLSAFVDALSGEQARQLGEYMRSAGAVDLLAELLDDADPQLPQWVLGTLANLCSDAFDPASAATKAILRDCNAMERLLRHLGSTDAATQLMATAALQNMCSDAELAATAVRYGAHTWLDALVCSDSASEPLKRFAAGALLNINDHPIPSSVDEGSGGRPQTPSTDGEGSCSGASEGGTPRRKKKGLFRRNSESSRSVLPVESVPASEGGEMRLEHPYAHPEPVSAALSEEARKAMEGRAVEHTGLQKEERLKHRMRLKMAQWRKERDERSGGSAAAAAESEAGGEAGRTLDSELERQSPRSDSGSSQRSAHSFISTVSSSACSYFTACSSASASTASSALAAMQGSRRAVVGDSVDMKQESLPVGCGRVVVIRVILSVTRVTSPKLAVARRGTIFPSSAKRPVECPLANTVRLPRRG